MERVWGCVPEVCGLVLSMRLTFLFVSAAVVTASSVAPAAAQSSATIEQVGSQNLAELAQGLAAGGPNDARIVQVGAGHVARLDQRGGGTADVVQDGAGHLLAGLTGGVPDPLAAALSLDGSELRLRQYGDGNRVFAEQRDGALAEVLQSGSGNLLVLAQSGGPGNQAFVDQAGGGVAHVTQTGAGNVARITQSDF